MFRFAQHDRMEHSAMKRAGIILLQLVVTAAGFWYVYHDPQRRAQIIDALRHASLSWLFLGWLCYGAVELLGSMRWQILLHIQGIRLSWWRVGAMVIVGLFFNQFLPGGVGGDAMRLYLVFRLVPRQKVGATLSIAMDRFLGLLSILFLAGVTLALRFRWLTQSGTSLHIIYLAVTVLGVAFVFVVLIFWLVKAGLVRRLPKTMPFREPIIQSARALLRYRAHPAAMALAFIITVVSHVAYYTSFYCAGRSLRVSPGHVATLADVVSIMPLVNTITSIPISIGGAGVRETLFQELLGNLAHVPPAIAAFTASLGYANQILWALVGGAVFLFSGKIIGRSRS
jgi:glycosyltransferase 2 family protein